jgi:hypothetical protein
VEILYRNGAELAESGMPWMEEIRGESAPSSRSTAGAGCMADPGGSSFGSTANRKNPKREQHWRHKPEQDVGHTPHSSEGRDLAGDSQ